MKEAIFGFIGVVIGAFIPWLQSYFNDKLTNKKNARYLAIRVVCILDKYLEDCVEVVKDDGLTYGQRDKDGCLRQQVKAPGVPVFPDDVDWKSIEHELMYKILSLPAEVESADRLIRATADITGPPDFEEWFEERKFHYSQFGLIAYQLSEELCEKYSIQKKVYNDWNPVNDLKKELQAVAKRRQERIESYTHFVKRVLGDK